MRKETLKDLVIKEAKSLKVHASKQMLKQLSFNRLHATLYSKCIYGQMTGSCFSPEAYHLIVSCAPKLIIGSINGGNDGTTPVGKCKSIAMTDFLFRNRRTIKKIKGEAVESKEVHFSPIEMFIAQKENEENGNNKRLIDYLKSKTSRLILK